MTDSPDRSIAARLSHIKAQLPPSITLVAVSKQQPVSSLVEALESGQRVFGENRVQEAKSKWPELRACYPGIALHLIGPLQTNKVQDALMLFDVIETLDRPRLAEMLAVSMQTLGKRPECYIQVNTGNEPQKSGISLEEADHFINECITRLHLPVTGLMCVPPEAEDPAPHFAQLHTLAARHALPNLSMGMSNDYQQAIQAGATHIRLGRAVFGERR